MPYGNYNTAPLPPRDENYEKEKDKREIESKIEKELRERLPIEFAYQLQTGSNRAELELEIKAFVVNIIEEANGDCKMEDLSVQSCGKGNRLIIRMPKKHADAVMRATTDGTTLTLPSGPEGETKLTVSNGTRNATGGALDDGMDAYWCHARIDSRASLPLAVVQDRIERHFNFFGYWLPEPPKLLPDRESGMMSNKMHVSIRPYNEREHTACNQMTAIKIGNHMIRLRFSDDYCKIMHVEACCLRPKEGCLCAFNKGRQREAAARNHTNRGNRFIEKKNQMKAAAAGAA